VKPKINMQDGVFVGGVQQRLHAEIFDPCRLWESQEVNVAEYAWKTE
jgi:hypothetical protein